jgi:hypothetical protein
VIVATQADSHFWFDFNALAAGSRRAEHCPMRAPLPGLVFHGLFLPGLFLPGLFLSAAVSLFGGQSFLQDVAESNVNRQYVIESVSVAGVEVPDARLPRNLGERLLALVGERCDVAMLEDLASEIRRQLHFGAVTEHLSKGSAPDRIKVNFDVVRKDVSFDLSLPKFLYHSQQNFTGEVDASAQIKRNTFAFGLVSNGDDLTERFSGLTARFDSAPVFPADNVRFAVVFEDYHEKWNQMTRNAVGDTGLDLYHSRWNVAPQIVFTVARPLEVALGASFEKTQSESSVVGDRSANAATADIHYGHKIEGNGVQQRIDARYNLRVATRALASTYAYARHMMSLKYEAKAGRHMASDEVIAGSIDGQAPFFDRFVLGSSSTLRGWNRYEIDPLGGTRVAHNEMTYGYRTNQGTVETFYDTGALWDAGQTAKLRQSLGAGFRKGIFVLTMAFPLRTGHVEPVFMAGMNY